MRLLLRCASSPSPNLDHNIIWLYIQTQRTIAVIKALGAIAPAIVSREVYYPGAKHLVPILELLLPGIDLVFLLSFGAEKAQF